MRYVNYKNNKCNYNKDIDRYNRTIDELLEDEKNMNDPFSLENQGINPDIDLKQTQIEELNDNIPYKVSNGNQITENHLKSILSSVLSEKYGIDHYDLDNPPRSLPKVDIELKFKDFKVQLADEYCDGNERNLSPIKSWKKKFGQLCFRFV